LRRYERAPYKALRVLKAQWENTATPNGLTPSRPLGRATPGDPGAGSRRLRRFDGRYSAVVHEEGERLLERCRNQARAALQYVQSPVQVAVQFVPERAGDYAPRAPRHLRTMYRAVVRGVVLFDLIHADAVLLRLELDRTHQLAVAPHIGGELVAPVLRYIAGIPEVYLRHPELPEVPHQVAGQVPVQVRRALRELPEQPPPPPVQPQELLAVARVPGAVRL